MPLACFQAGDLVGALSGPGPFTVFAPSNEAFAALPAATLARLLDPANIQELVKVLTFHVVAGTPIANLQRLGRGQKTSALTVEGEPIELVNSCTNRKCSRSVLRINPTGLSSPAFAAAGPRNAEGDAAANGVIQMIDTVLIPTPADQQLWFRQVQSRFGVSDFRCGEVNAGARMPAAIFEPGNAAQLQEYEDATLTLYNRAGPPG